MNNSLRAWIFRLLVIIISGIMVLLWLNPWWSCDFDGIGTEVVSIYPWGLDMTKMGQLASIIEDANMPAWFKPFMWVFLGLCIVSLLVSLFVKEKIIKFKRIKISIPNLLIALVGIAMTCVVVVMIIFAAIRTGDFWGMKLIGATFISLGYPAEGTAHGYLRAWYWIACGTAFILIVLALLRNKIIGINPYSSD
ncbi:MAG: hypothetical protein GX272_13255 [Epulopiscium sp.]|nr:hypothetical protein [Candidatus Epulonipiscium sp.]